MPFGQEVQFLRARAPRLQQMAASHRTALSQQLETLAEELEVRANELEQSASRNGERSEKRSLGGGSRGFDETAFRRSERHFTLR